jgi:ATP diphosphatase
MPADNSKIQKLLAIMEQLRDPETGCPWDREQDFSTIAPYTIEEAYEVADAIQHGRMDELIPTPSKKLTRWPMRSSMAAWTS